MAVSDTINLSGSSVLPTTRIKLYIEGYGGKPKIESPVLSLSKIGWEPISYVFKNPGFDVYRFGIRIVSGDGLMDTPVTYIAPKEGDEWDLGITVGEFPTDTEQVDAGWNKHRFTTTYEWKKAKETLYDLSNMDSDNFWYEIDRYGKFNLWINRGSDTVNVSLAYPKNITSMSVTSNADDVVNYLVGDGSADVKQDPLVSGVENDNAAPFTWISNSPTSMKKYWALAEKVRYDSERTIEALKADLDAEINTQQVLQSVPTIKIENNAVTPDQFALGDIVSVEAHDIPYVKDVNGLYKIIGYDIRVDLDGNESVSLTLINPSENQINSLAFPQLIKNLLNRLHGVR